MAETKNPRGVGERRAETRLFGRRSHGPNLDCRVLWNGVQADQPDQLMPDYRYSASDYYTIYNGIQLGFLITEGYERRDLGEEWRGRTR